MIRTRRFPTLRCILTNLLAVALACAVLAARTAPQPALVNIRDLSSTISVDVPYAAAGNFTGARLYSHNICLLRPSVARALVEAHRDFVARGYRLKMLDCYRPKSVSLAMWKAGEDHNRACRALGHECKRGGCDPARPDCLWEPLTNYLSRASKHNRGATVDVTLVRLMGRPVDMGTPYDFFGPEARTSNATGRILENRLLLNQVMALHGFANYFREWWHYDHNTYKNFPVLDVPFKEFVKSLE